MVLGVLPFHGLLAQTSPWQPLPQVLDSLAEHHSVTFNYLDSVVVGKEVSLPKAESLSYTLNALENQAGIRFEKISEGVYVIRQATRRVVCGRLIHAQEGTPLAQALVYGENFAVTDEEGKFAISVAPGSTLRVQMLGFYPRVLRVDSLLTGPCPDIAMTPEVRMLPNVTIYDYLSPGINRADDGSYSLAVDPLRLMPGFTNPDVFHSLLFLPGVQSANETVADLNIRGGTHDQNLLLLDGVRLYQPGHFFGLISAVNPQAIQRATVIKEGTPAQYGDAVSGTLVLQSTHTVPQRRRLRVGANLLHADVAVEWPLGKNQGLSLAARQSISPWATTPTLQGYTQRAFAHTEVLNSNTDSSSFDNNLRFGYGDYHLKYLGQWAGRHRLEVFGWHIRNQLSFDETGMRNGEMVAEQSQLAQQSLAGGVEYAFRWGTGALSEVLLSASHYALQAENADIAASQTLLQANEVLDYQAKIGHRYLWGSTDGSFGYQYNNLGVTNVNELDQPQFGERIKDVVTIHAAYWEHNFAFGQGSRLRAGARATYYYEPQRFFLDPRVRFSQQLGPHWSAEASLEGKNQVVFQRIDLQTDFLGVEKRRWRVLDATPFHLIHSLQASVGIQASYGGWRAHLSGYAKEVNNISLTSQGMVNGVSSLGFRGANRVYGSEVLVKYRREAFTSWVSYSFMQNRFNFDSLIPARFPSTFEIPHAGSWGANYKQGPWQVAAGMKMQLGRPYTGLLEDETTYAAPNQHRTPPYYRLDAAVQYEWHLGRYPLQLGVAAQNLLNRTNLVNRYFIPLADGGWEEQNLQGLPFTLNASIRLEL